MTFLSEVERNPSLLNTPSRHDIICQFSGILLPYFVKYMAPIKMQANGFKYIMLIL